MTIREILDKSWAAVHQTSRSPRRGVDNYTTMIGYIDRAVQNWANQAHVKWRVLRTVDSLGPIVADQTEYITDGSQGGPTISPNLETRPQGSRAGEGVYIEWTDTDNKTRKTRIRLTSPPDLSPPRRNVCTIAAGRLILSAPFKEQDPEIGGQLMVVHYPAPERITVSTPETDTTPVPDPNYVVYHAAYSLAEADLVQNRLAQGMLLNADERMEAMINDNKLLSQARNSDPYWTGGRYN